MMRDPRSERTVFFSYFWMYLSFPEDNWGQEHKKTKTLNTWHDHNYLCPICRCVLDSSFYRCESSLHQFTITIPVEDRFLQHQIQSVSQCPEWSWWHPLFRFCSCEDGEQEQISSTGFVDLHLVSSLCL